MDLIPYRALAERLYGGGWRITVIRHEHDMAFYRYPDWSEWFPCDLAEDELRKHGWDIAPEHRYGYRMPTFGWTYRFDGFETWWAPLLRREDAPPLMLELSPVHRVDPWLQARELI